MFPVRPRAVQAALPGVVSRHFILLWKYSLCFSSEPLMLRQTENKLPRDFEHPNICHTAYQCVLSNAWHARARDRFSRCTGMICVF